MWSFDKKISLTQYKESVFFKEIFLKSWWVFLFLVICVIGYDRAIQQRDYEYERLLIKLHGIQQTKEKALEQQKQFILQINSQNDYEWIELNLMKILGLVPENYTKVFFNLTPDNDDET